MHIIPIGDKVLIEKVEKDQADSYTTSSGIIVMDKDNRPKGRVSIGKVIDYGSTFLDSDKVQKNISDLISKGDYVIYYNPAEFKVDPENERLVIIRAIDIDSKVTLTEDEIKEGVRL